MISHNHPITQQECQIRDKNEKHNDLKCESQRHYEG